MATYAKDINELPLELTRTLVAGNGLPLLMQLKLNGTAVNLTGATLSLGGTKPGGAAMTQRTITPSSPTTGAFDAGLTKTDTAGWATGTARYQVLLTFPANNADVPSLPKTIIEVTVNVRPSLVTSA